jgi:hypothetical protein
MGCDIHGFIEVKQKDRWVCKKKHNLKLHRDYYLFTLLADVRNYSKIEYEQKLYPRKCLFDEFRGLPSDVSNFVEKESNNWGCDGHSHSFITLEEFEKIDYDEPIFPIDGSPAKLIMDNFNNVKVTLREIIKSNCDYFEIIDELKSLKKKPDEVRLVFWFDN